MLDVPHGARARAFIDQMGAALADAGLPAMPARAFAALLIDEDGRMTAAELGDALGASAGSISGAVRYLTQLQMVRRERVRGSRRDVYVVDDDAWYAAMMRKDQSYAPMIAALERADLDTTGSPAHRRIALTREFLRFVDSEMTSLADRWQQHRREFLAALDERD